MPNEPIIHTLMQYGDESATFTVNTAVSYVNVTPDTGHGILSLTDTINKFAFKDNLNILSIGLMLPFGFELYEYENSALSKYRPAYIQSQILRVGDYAPFVLIDRINLPFENYELNLGWFVSPSVTIGDRFYLSAFLPAAGNEILRISMLNVPAALNEGVFHCPIFAKVQHTLPMEI